MAEQDKKILVCIPAFNESKTIAEIISKSRCYATEVLVKNKPRSRRIRGSG